MQFNKTTDEWAQEQNGNKPAAEHFYKSDHTFKNLADK